jgi:hypothetical protein
MPGLKIPPALNQDRLPVYSVKQDFTLFTAELYNGTPLKTINHSEFKAGQVHYTE